MDVIISSLQFKADAKLEDFIREKLSKLTSIFDGVISCEVTLKLNQSSNNENKISEIKVIIPGNDLFAKKQAKTFEEAVDSTVEALKKQLKKYKDKLRGQ